MSNNGHITRFSDSSLYDEICTKCGATDASGDIRLERRCPQGDVVNVPDLLPCPCCGSTNVHMEITRCSECTDGVYVECSNCGLRTAAWNEETAAKYWNTRVR